AVEAHVADRRSSALRGAHGAADEWLVNVAETGAAAVQEGEKLLVVPSGVAHFDHQGIIAEKLEQFFEVRARFRRVVEREGKLEQDGAEAANVAKNVETGAD